MVDIIASYYESLKENKEKKQLFFTFLAQYLGPNHEDISNSAEKVVDLYKQVCLPKGNTCRQSPYQNVLCTAKSHHDFYNSLFLATL